MDEADIQNEITHVQGPNGEPVVLVPSYQPLGGKTEIDQSVTIYEGCAYCCVCMGFVTGIPAFVMLMIAVFSSGGTDVFYIAAFSLLGFLLFFCLLAVPCCLRTRKLQAVRVQQFMYRGDNIT